MDDVEFRSSSFELFISSISQKPIAKDLSANKDLDSTQASDNYPSDHSTRPITHNSIYIPDTKVDDITIDKGILSGRTKILMAVLAAAVVIGAILSLPLFFHFNHLSTATTIAPNIPNQPPHIIPKTPGNQIRLNPSNPTIPQTNIHNKTHTITPKIHDNKDSVSNQTNSTTPKPNHRNHVPFLPPNNNFLHEKRYNSGWNDGAIACNDNQTIPEINSYLISDDYTKHHTDMYHQGYGAALAHCNLHIVNGLVIEKSNP